MSGFQAAAVSGSVMILVIALLRLTAGVPLPDAPGRVTPTPTPETLDIMIDEEAMGDLAERIATPTPAPEMTPEPIYNDPEVDAPFPDDL